MVNQPKTPHSSFRIPADLKAEAQAKATAEGWESLTAVVVTLLREWVTQPPPSAGTP